MYSNINSKHVFFCMCACVLSHSVVSNSLRPFGLRPIRLPCPWDFPGKNTDWSELQFLLQGIFPTQGLSLCVLHWQADSLPVSHREAHTFYMEESNSGRIDFNMILKWIQNTLCTFDKNHLRVISSDYIANCRQQQ